MAFLTPALAASGVCRPLRVQYLNLHFCPLSWKRRAAKGTPSPATPLGCGPGKGDGRKLTKSWGRGERGFAEFLPGEARWKRQGHLPPLLNYVTLTHLGGYSRAEISLREAESLQTASKAPRASDVGTDLGAPDSAGGGIPGGRTPHAPPPPCPAPGAGSPRRGVGRTSASAGRPRPHPHPGEHLAAVTCGAETLRSPLASPPPPLPRAEERCPSPGARAASSAGPAPFSEAPSSGAGKSPQRRWKRATSWESCRLRSSSAIVSPGPPPPRRCPRLAVSPPHSLSPGGRSGRRAGGARGASQQVRRSGPSAAPRAGAQVAASTLRRACPALPSLPAGSHGLGRPPTSGPGASGRRRTGV